MSATSRLLAALPATVLAVVACQSSAPAGASGPAADGVDAGAGASAGEGPDAAPPRADPDAAGPLGHPGDGGAAPAPACATDLVPWLARLDVPGLSAGIVKNGKLVCTAVAGMANIEEQRPVTPDTLFCVASVSKTITATAAMQAVDDGKLSLDEDVNARLPFSVRVPGCSATPVTLRELLAHTSSITDNPALINCPGDCKYGDPLVATVARGADSPIALSALVPGYLVPGGTYYGAANFLAGCPGTVSSYSNMGVVLAGYMVEATTGIRLEQFTKERIFQPLGMTETAWKLADIDPTHLAMPYDKAAGAFKALGQFGEPDWPDGMLRTSVPELARFLAMFAQLGEYSGRQILARSSAQEMRRVQAPALDDSQGLVWFFDDFGAARPKVMGHDGSDNGVSANMYFDPADGAGVIVMSNGMWASTPTTSNFADVLMETLFKESTSY